MHTILRLLGTSGKAADHAIDVINRITVTDVRDYAFGAFALFVAAIDIALYIHIVGGAL